MRTKFLALILAAFSIVSCKKDIEQEGTPVQDMAGEWWVQIYLNDEVYDDSYYHIYTYNTAAFDVDKMWVDASDAWPFYAKATVNYSNLEFLESEPVTDDFYQVTYPQFGLDVDTITITGGKVLKGVSTPPSKTTTDSINIQFTSTVFKGEDWDDLQPGDRYSLRGYRRTGFAADDH